MFESFEINPNVGFKVDTTQKESFLKNEINRLLKENTSLKVKTIYYIFSVRDELYLRTAKRRK